MSIASGTASFSPSGDYQAATVETLEAATAPAVNCCWFAVATAVAVETGENVVWPWQRLVTVTSQTDARAVSAWRCRRAGR